MVPCSFCPLSILFSSCSQLPSLRAKAAAHLRLRPPKQVVTRSARPHLLGKVPAVQRLKVAEILIYIVISMHDSMKVASFTFLKNIFEKRDVSSRPIRMMAALVLPP